MIQQISPTHPQTNLLFNLSLFLCSPWKLTETEESQGNVTSASGFVFEIYVGTGNFEGKKKTNHTIQMKCTRLFFHSVSFTEDKIGRAGINSYTANKSHLEEEEKSWDKEL